MNFYAVEILVVNGNTGLNQWYSIYESLDLMDCYETVNKTFNHGEKWRIIGPDFELYWDNK